ncbi:hypothetical protein [Flammeovirga aprica]|uniref:Uncharacterized protein n=1 Tax=Flammeovirga aprica JL-4 TaxID=694437 RepID=A0A7X9P005_9BACT|nr:hypothetical protein [Flammeovirga aprica]NME67013.1 hypothetical protein [Flammeovirga aprica JL-4]
MTFFLKSKPFFLFLLLSICAVIFQACNVDNEETIPDVDFNLSLSGPSFLRGTSKVELNIESKEDVPYELNNVQLFNNGNEIESELKKESGKYFLEFDSKELGEGIQQLSIEVPVVVSGVTSDALSSSFQVEVDNFLPPFQFTSAFVKNLEYTEETGSLGDWNYYFDSETDFEYSIYFTDHQGNPISEAIDIMTFNDEVNVEIPSSVEGQNFYLAKVKKFKKDYFDTYYDEVINEDHLYLIYDFVSSSDMELHLYDFEDQEDYQITIKVPVSISNNYEMRGSFTLIRTEDDYNYYEVSYTMTDDHGYISGINYIYSDDFQKGVVIIPELYENGATVTIEEGDIKDFVGEQSYDMYGDFINIYGVIDIDNKEVYYPILVNKYDFDAEIRTRYMYSVKDGEDRVYAVSRFRIEDTRDLYITKHFESLPIDISSFDFPNSYHHNLSVENDVYSIERQDFMEDDDRLYIIAEFEGGMNGERKQVVEVLLLSTASAGAQLDLSTGLDAHNLYDGHFENLRTSQLTKTLSYYESEKAVKEDGFTSLRYTDHFNSSSRVRTSTKRIMDQELEIIKR